MCISHFKIDVNQQRRQIFGVSFLNKCIYFWNIFEKNKNFKIKKIKPLLLKLKWFNNHFILILFLITFLKGIFEALLPGQEH